MGKRRTGRPASQEIRTLHGAFPDDELDLHGCTATEAESRLKHYLDRWSRTQPGAVLRVITGKGSGSSGAPVLRTRVHELLTGDLSDRIVEWAGDGGGGAFLVRVR